MATRFCTPAATWLTSVFDLEILVALMGDADLDCDVDFADFNYLANNYTGPLDPDTGGKLWEHGDFDGDGDVDFSDFNILANHYTGPGDGCTHPEGEPGPAADAAVGLRASFEGKGRRAPRR